MDERFDTLDEKLAGFDKRIRDSETDITIINTVGLGTGAVVTFFGWESLKHWLTSLIRS